MIRTSLAVLTIVFVANVALAQDINCFPCKAGSAFSADNVHLLRSHGAEPPSKIVDFRWHK